MIRSNMLALGLALTSVSLACQPAAQTLTVAHAADSLSIEHVHVPHGGPVE